MLLCGVSRSRVQIHNFSKREIAKMRTDARRWVFTLNNYTEAEVESFTTLFQSLVCRYGIFGKEVASSGTPHLQGFIIFHGTKTLSAIKRDYNSRAHWIRARGTSEQASNYCKKDGDFFEHGVCPRDGQRTELDCAREWIKGFVERELRAPSDRELASEHPGPYIRYKRGLLDYARAIAPAPRIREGDLRGWQDELRLSLEEPAHDRKIKFYVDITGNKGKTWFIGYYMTMYPEKTQVLGCGNKTDMAYAYDEMKSVVFINVPRGGMEFLVYRFLEEMKDRMVFSTKYDSRLKIAREVPHVIIMCNEYPDVSKMSADRFDIVTLN
jgi:hypothetical protein